ncbi:hypothetical protein [Neolewinella agarilytica]|uniref:Uncharacterized protein n=1 Tax=Neolewinella agarilytica TaxID=478744 RepID=A0A1H9LKK6_9BACT|nr:hypothetical protein [Neolewinella agarilytica]SER11950.1 hypothetical protein SAMN05444359_12479 [Neolewinella agarilytica]
MTLEAKKISIIQLILGLNNEEVIDQLTDSLVGLKADLVTEKPFPFVTYADIKRKKFDLDEVKKEQEYRPFEEGELDQLIREADVQESIDELLEALNS